MWQRIEDQPDFENRPHRQFILVEGWQAHSGVTWARAHWGIARICREDQPDYLMGYQRADVERIMREDAMDGVDRIDYWMPAKCPPFPPTVRV